jgi:hypothetical protein
MGAAGETPVQARGRMEQNESIIGFKILQMKADPAQPDPDRPDRNKEQICHFEDIKCIEDLQRVSTEVVWQNFERLTAFVFEENNFRASTNTVKTLKRKRRQYDVIAKTNSKTFLVECKKWAGNRSRLSALKRAIDQHIERTEFYRYLTGENAVPIVVTLVEEEIRSYDGVPIVPILRLNSFINELDQEEQDEVALDHLTVNSDENHVSKESG